MTTINNPILAGFHPDPSMICVEDVFYLANSTFEYYPGVKLSKSVNLKDWETVGYPLSEKRLLDMVNQDASSGVWAPCLSYSNGLFYLVYSNVRTFKLEGMEGIPFHDDYNYLTTAPSIEGPWSDPVFIGTGGFDASLFHDTDGRKWYLYAKWTWIKEKGAEEQHSAGFFGIALQEYSEQEHRLIGEEKIIFKGTARGLVEGPHLYKKAGYYYLLTAEGGTEYEHACTIARSRSLFGPYETRPENPYLVTSDINDGEMLQKSGHGALVKGPQDDWYLTHLCARPIKTSQEQPFSKENSYSILGRETALAPVIWQQDWPYIAGGGNHPVNSFDVPYLSQNQEQYTIKDDFDELQLSSDYQYLRTLPEKNRITVTEKPGFLRVYGKDSIVSRYHQSTVVRRQQWLTFTTHVKMSFAPDSYQQLAGFLYRYNESNQYYAFMSFDEQQQKRYISLMAFDKGKFHSELAPRVYLETDEPVLLGMDVSYGEVQFKYSLDEETWHTLGEQQSALILSDEYCWPGFTGAMFGVSVQDAGSRGRYADFDYLVIHPLND